MNIALLTALIGVIFAANVSAEDFINFVNEDRELVCEGSKARWLLPNKTEITQNGLKYKMESDENESKLLIRKVNANDIGAYRCSTDKVDEIYNIKIYYPLAIDQHSSSETVKENGEVSFKCKTNGVPTASMKWYFGDDELVESSNIKITPSSITFKNIKKEQAGEYTCVAVQQLKSFQNVQERTFNLIVEYAPKLLRKENPIIIKGNIGESVTLECDADSVPNSHFLWLQNGYEIFENIEVFNKMSRHKVQLESQESFKNYTCIVFNELGEKKQFFMLQEDDEDDDINHSSLTTVSIAALIFILTALFF